MAEKYYYGQASDQSTQDDPASPAGGTGNATGTGPQSAGAAPTSAPSSTNAGADVTEVTVHGPPPNRNEGVDVFWYAGSDVEMPRLLPIRGSMESVKLWGVNTHSGLFSANIGAVGAQLGTPLTYVAAFSGVELDSEGNYDSIGLYELNLGPVTVGAYNQASGPAGVYGGVSGGAEYGPVGVHLSLGAGIGASGSLSIPDPGPFGWPGISLP